MAAGNSAGQYEDAFSAHRLQNWSVPRPGQKHLSLQKGPTPVIANDRGHLLPTVPRSQDSPWGTFVGTWDMPSRIPPARLSLTSRSAAAAARLLGQVQQGTTLTRACNGLRTEITGKPQEPQSDTQTAKELSRRSRQPSSKVTASPRTAASLRGTPREASPEAATRRRSSAPSRSRSGAGRAPGLQQEAEPPEGRSLPPGASPPARRVDPEPPEGRSPPPGASPPARRVDAEPQDRAEGERLSPRTGLLPASPANLPRPKGEEEEHAEES